MNNGTEVNRPTCLLLISFIAASRHAIQGSEHTNSIQGSISSDRYSGFATHGPPSRQCQPGFTFKPVTYPTANRDRWILLLQRLHCLLIGQEMVKWSAMWRCWVEANQTVLANGQKNCAYVQEVAALIAKLRKRKWWWYRWLWWWWQWWCRWWY